MDTQFEVEKQLLKMDREKSGREIGGKSTRCSLSLLVPNHKSHHQAGRLSALEMHTLVCFHNRVRSKYYAEKFQTLDPARNIPVEMNDWLNDRLTITVQAVFNRKLHRSHFFRVLRVSRTYTRKKGYMVNAALLLAKSVKSFACCLKIYLTESSSGNFTTSMPF